MNVKRIHINSVGWKTSYELFFIKRCIGLDNESKKE